MMILHLCTNNDNNGNPRRVFIHIRGNAVIEAWDEGYKGHHAVPEFLWQDASQSIRIEITPKEYKRILKEYSK